MIEIELRADLIPLLNRLQNFQWEIPFVIASSLTKTAVKVKPEIRKEMEKVFDRPTRYTLNSIFVEPAKKKDANPTARVGLKDGRTTKQGTPPAHYLWPQIAGGSRSLTPFEYILRTAGILPLGMFVVPGKGCEIDPTTGNVSTGQINAILSRFNLNEMARKYPGTRKRKTKYAGAQYFIAHGNRLARFAGFIRQPTSNHLPEGIWQRMPDHHVSPIYLFVKRMNYHRIFEFDQVARGAALKLLPGEFEAAIDSVLRELD